MQTTGQTLSTSGDACRDLLKAAWFPSPGVPLQISWKEGKRLASPQLPISETSGLHGCHSCAACPSALQGTVAERDTTFTVPLSGCLPPRQRHASRLSESHIWCWM